MLALVRGHVCVDVTLIFQDTHVWLRDIPSHKNDMSTQTPTPGVMRMDTGPERPPPSSDDEEESEYEEEEEEEEEEDTDDYRHEI